MKRILIVEMRNIQLFYPKLEDHPNACEYCNKRGICGKKEANYNDRSDSCILLINIMRRPSEKFISLFLVHTLLLTLEISMLSNDLNSGWT